ncbi:cytochrome c/c1 heme-lyase [Gigaspora rosea]|uniref:Holocytochrome c-type synthase n=1 Tax=Gigaspora rosea TaxID=44941 RepID=A0A397W8M0_9GLOM|nr:cytochrome c/c1 heme-lyase [Gigaspora rosea]
MSENSNSTGDTASCPVNHSSWFSIFAPKTSVKPKNSVTLQCPVDNRSHPKVSPELVSPEFSKINKNEGCSSDTLNNYNKSLHSDQNSSSDQRIPLDTTRQVSSIPRAFSDRDKNIIEKWIYPSEQMFFNAMKRKDWDPQEEDMRVIVPIHNAVNEKAWQEILEWEKLHENHCGGPKLVKFQGKAKNITPKARLFNLLGYKLPFDRHDWVIDRCGKQVTYVIDFYSGQPDPKLPYSVSFYLDVRPALTLDGAIDRFRRCLYLFMERNNQSNQSEEKCKYKSRFINNDT